MLTDRRASRVCSAVGIFGQSAPMRLESAKPFMFFMFIRPLLVCFFAGALFGLPAAAMAQTNYYGANGVEYSIIGSLPTDQVFPDAAVAPTGGFLVWQDNITDGSGWGVSARRLDSTLSGTLSTFRVNQQGTNSQENPRVALLKNGGAVFVWQGGKLGYQHIFARFLTPTNTFLSTTDLVVSTFSNNFQINPSVVTLNNSNVVVVWASFNQAGSNSLQDVYAKILSPTGQTVSNEFRINQFINYNQRTPAVAALKNGGFVVTWVSEQQRVLAPDLGVNTNYTASGAMMLPSVDLYARIYSNGGAAQGNEFIVNTGSNPCANPAVVPAADGGFMVTWGARDMASSSNSFDIYARPFSSAGVGGTGTRINTYVYSGQFAPRISAIGAENLIIWTSLGQDGSREGVYGRLVHADGSPVGSEFRVNTTTVSQQMQPVIVSDGTSQFLAIWTSYAGSPNSFDLFAQRYLSVSALLQPMTAPFVYAPFALSNGVYQPQLQVSWPLLLGISVSYFEVYTNNSSVPAALTSSNVWTMTAANGLTVNSTHSFRVDYVTTDGRTSPISLSTSGTTWSGYNWGGIPFEWMTQFYGSDLTKWPGASADSDGDGMSAVQEFLSGTVPTNSASALKVQLTKTAQGYFLGWETLPGLTYQVLVSTNLTTWSNLGAPRFAAGGSDSVYVGGGASGYYRVVLLR